MGAVTAAEADRARSIDDYNEVDSQYTVEVKDFVANESFGHSGHDRLNLVDLQIRKGRIQGIAMRKTLYAKEGLELTNGRAVSEQESNLPSRLELKQKHRDTGEGKTRKGISNLDGISGIGDVGE
jgi:hypothetical protein